MRRALLLSAAACVCAVAVAGCHGALRGLSASALDGFSSPLKAGASLRLEVDGQVGEKPATILFDVDSPLTIVSGGCLAPGDVGRWVSFTAPTGGRVKLREITVEAIAVAGVPLGPLMVGFEPREESRCIVSLGNDVLMPYALHVDPARRWLTITRSLERADYVAALSKLDAGGEEVHLVELARDPTMDWPVVSVRLRQRDATWVAPFVLSTRDTHTVVSDSAARKAGLSPGPDIIKELGFEGQLPLPPALEAPGYPLDALELAPGFGLRWDAAAADVQWTNPGAGGAVGSDVWGRFDTTLDPRAGVMVLRRPRVETFDRRQRCPGPGGSSEEACFQLAANAEPGKPVHVLGTVWRDLPEGGRVYLEPLGPDGKPLQLACRVGFTFDKEDRGVSAEHSFPWEGMQHTLPRCAQELHRVHSFALGLFEEGALHECPGECAFAQELMTGRATCECAPQLWGGGTDAERRFLQIYWDLIHRNQGQPKLSVPPEPKDPDS